MRKTMDVAVYERKLDEGTFRYKESRQELALSEALRKKGFDLPRLDHILLDYANLSMQEPVVLREIKYFGAKIEYQRWLREGVADHLQRENEINKLKKIEKFLKTSKNNFSIMYFNNSNIFPCHVELFFPDNNSDMEIQLESEESKRLFERGIGFGSSRYVGYLKNLKNEVHFYISDIPKIILGMRLSESDLIKGLTKATLEGEEDFLKRISGA